MVSGTCSSCCWLCSCREQSGAQKRGVLAAAEPLMCADAGMAIEAGHSRSKVLGELAQEDGGDCCCPHLPEDVEPPGVKALHKCSKVAPAAHQVQPSHQQTHPLHAKEQGVGHTPGLPPMRLCAGLLLAYSSPYDCLPPADGAHRPLHGCCAGSRGPCHATRGDQWHYGGRHDAPAGSVAVGARSMTATGWLPQTARRPSAVAVSRVPEEGRWLGAAD